MLCGFVALDIQPGQSVSRSPFLLFQQGAADVEVRFVEINQLAQFQLEWRLVMFKVNGLERLIEFLISRAFPRDIL